MLLMNPLNRAFRIEQNRSEIRGVLRLEARVNKVACVSAQHFGRMFRNQPKQTLAPSAVGTLDQDYPRAQSFGRGLADGELAKIQRWNGPAMIIEKSCKAVRRLRQLLQRQHRQDLHDPLRL